MLSIPQSTAYVVVFKAYLASDHVTEATGKTIAITISKNGGAFGNPNVGALNATEISSGWYKFTLDTTDTATIGPIAIRGAVATIDDVGLWLNVVSATTGGLTNLDAAVSTRASQTSVDTVDDFLDTEIAAIKTKTDFLPSATAGSAGGLFIAGTNAATVVTTSFTTTFTGNLTGSVASVTGAVGSVTGSVGSVTGLTASNLDATVSSRLASASYTTPPTANANADALLDRAAGIETGLTPRQGFRLFAAALLGKASGLATTTAVYRDTGDTKARITATVDADGNRSAVTLDAT